MQSTESPEPSDQRPHGQGDKSSAQAGPSDPPATGAPSPDTGAASSADPKPSQPHGPDPVEMRPEGGRGLSQVTVRDLLVGFYDAFRFLTRLKFPEAICPPEARDCAPGEPARPPHPLSMVMFPVVGLFLGALVWTGCWFGDLILPRPTMDLMALAFLAVITGGMHWDGLMDAADALGAPKERRAEVMHDVHVGSYAMLALVFTAGGMWGVLNSLQGWQHGSALLLFPVWGRWMVLAVSHEMPHLRKGKGIAGAFLAELSRKQLLAATGFCLVITILLQGLWGTLLLFLGLSLAAALLRRVIRKGFNGISSDLMSAGGCLGELMALLMLAVVSQFT